MLYAIIAAIIIIVDQWVKYWTTINIVLDTGETALIPGVLKLVNIHNSGAAFGFLGSTDYMRWVFVGIAAVFVIALLIIMAARVFPSKFATLCCTFAIAGAIGNCIDRFLFGYVVDMFKLEFIKFAVFNVADVFLTIACILFFFYFIFGYNGKEEIEAEPKKDKADRKAEKKAAREAKKAKKAKSRDVEKAADSHQEKEIKEDEDIAISEIQSEFLSEEEKRALNLDFNMSESETNPKPTATEEVSETEIAGDGETLVEENADVVETEGNAHFEIDNAFWNGITEKKSASAPTEEVSSSSEDVPASVLEKLESVMAETENKEEAPTKENIDLDELVDLGELKQEKPSDASLDSIEYSLEDILEEFK